MIRLLDLTSFPNSTGPRRARGKRTAADYGFTVVRSFDDGWAEATEADGSWQIGVFVLQDGRARKRLCFTDTALNGGAYRSTQTIDVAPDPKGLWRAVTRVGSVPGCAAR